ncbi:helix-turn-helix transcriptional regulator [Lederbergia wuyishanensis]|uniref:YesN/AraC family two-component response regulator n=1 Tax=Lederbergia wuyishanensis TaxID=1347903 RepID=A0ABU0D7M2_9BACI|nr:AraC family transcriptional regulator [Lederbergia wuyishanensis]MCJ8009086.1 AraC family transcriptional regulator [Lederbergia wuyishanensis]MDQ0344423.1 YesN/AraC family two-component response regulator [Lederbergia wuyishanensis]
MEKFITVRGFMRIFSVLLIIVLIMFSINYYLMKTSTQRLYEQMKENNRLIVSGIIESIDDTFREINNLIYSIDTLPYDPKDKDEGSYIHYLLYKDMHKLITISSSHDYIEDVVVFFDDSDLAITSQGTIDLNEFFNEQYKNKQHNAMFWKSFFNDEKTLEIFPAKTYLKKTSGKNYRPKNLITIAGNTQFSSKNILVYLNVDTLLESINQRTMMDETSFLILDQNNNIVLSTKDKISLGEVVRGLYLGAGEETVVKNQKYEYVVYKSDYNGFTYINRIPIKYTAVASITNDQQTIMLISGFVTLLLLLGASLYLFRPIKKASLIIGGEPNWRSIFHSIIQLKQDFQESKNIEKRMQTELSKYKFIQAITQSRDNVEMYSQLNDYVSDLFTYRHFLLIQLTFESKQSSEMIAELQIEECKKIIESGLKEDLHLVTYFHHIDKEFLVLVGINRSSERKNVIQTIEQFIKHAQKSMNSTINAVISKVYDSKLENLALAYQDIIHSTIYRNIGVEGSVHDTQTIQPKAHVYFPIENVEKLPNLIVGKNEKDSIQIIEDIIEQNIDLNIQRHQFVAILQSLLLYMKRHLQLNEEEQQNLHMLELEFDSSIRNYKNLEDLKSTFMQVVKYILQKGSHAKAQDNKLNPAFIAQYIELHYMDNLYLEHMASVTDTSPKYFSKYFKNAFGINFIEYLHRVRINHAKEYLKNEYMTIAEIGEKVGYLNATTFASTFKKYTGLSPSNYREKIINTG